MTKEPDSLLREAAEDDAAFEILVEKYSPLIQSMSSRYFSILDDEEAVLFSQQDFVQEARLAFYRALKRYDSTQTDVSFGLYAKICIRNALVSQLRKIRSEKRKRRKMVEPAPSADMLRELSDREETHALLARIRDNLSAYENEVLDLYMQGMTVRKIAAALGEPTKSVSNAMYRIRSKVKDLCNI